VVKGLFHEKKTVQTVEVPDKFLGKGKGRLEGKTPKASIGKLNWLNGNLRSSLRVKQGRKRKK